MGRERGMALFSGIMARFSKEIGKMGQKMGSEYGDLPRVIRTKANGLITDSMALAVLNTKIVPILENMKIS